MPPGRNALWPALVVVAVVYLLPAARRWGRAVTTVVHEAGHATMGVLTGRRFHGFVVERNLAGSAVTSGRSHGPARVLTTWAGYPAPALVGTVMVGAALAGWSGFLLVLGLLALVVLLVMSRSLRTVGLVVLIGALTAALWWWGDAVGVVALRAGLVAGVGMVLLVGAWDSLADVARSRDGAQDHRTLTALTRVPSGLWLASWFLVDAAATALVGWWVWVGLR
ncbi:MAG: M50 family metallopeptidase [Actinomyces sp.]|uniref:M50 family metallopeptidase n=1 Tax=Actinomyces sp. TaxID=29317 RepID=UPI0026DD47ED|nr:M50 family metallopeptidase [Actinomyces sp.]MDO4243963.1 M50 family metallopeptidase [Actinomyces sp.]